MDDLHALALALQLLRVQLPLRLDRSEQHAPLAPVAFLSLGQRAQPRHLPHHCALVPHRAFHCPLVMGGGPPLLQQTAELGLRQQRREGEGRGSAGSQWIAAVVH